MTLKDIFQKKYITWTFVLRIVMVVSIILAFIKKDYFWVAGTFVGLFISLLPTIFKRNIKFTLPWTFDFFIAIISILHVGGRLLDYYYTIPNYLLFTRLIISFFVAFLAFTMIYILDVYWDGLIMDKYAMAFMTVVFTMFVGVILEFVKWLNITGTYYIKTNMALMQNLTADTIAGVIIAFIGVSLIKRGRFDKLTGDFGRQVDEMIIDRMSAKK